MLRMGSAGSNTAADHIEVNKSALAHFVTPGAATRPGGVDPHRGRRRHRHGFAWRLTGQRPQYPVGFGLSLDAVARST